MLVDDFINKLINITENYKTLYVMGCFGAPLNEKNKKRYSNNHPYNKKEERQKMIYSASSDTFGFDCVNLLKAIFWEWNGDLFSNYGGAKYKINDVPDVSADGFIKLCNTSDDFSNIIPGCAVWMPGHIGVYIGDGKVVECSPKWNNGVQYSFLKNKGYNKGNGRMWKLWGFIPWINYEKKEEKNIYNKIEEVPKWGKEAVSYFIDKKYILGNGKGELMISFEMLRILVILYRIIKG